MRGNYERAGEQATLQVTASKMIIKAGAQTLALDYEVKSIKGGDVTIDLMMPVDHETAALELLVHLREDGGLYISSPLPHAGGGFPGRWTPMHR